MDDGFTYRVPTGLDTVSVGSIVRIPLGGRRVRGFVVGLREDKTDTTAVRDDKPARKIKDLSGVSGDLPIFDGPLLETLRWAALHYVGPLATLLARCAPANLPRVKAADRAGIDLPPVPDRSSSVPALSSLSAGGRIRSQYLVSGGPWADVVTNLAADTLRADRNVCVVAPTFAEASSLHDALRDVFGARVLLSASALPAKESTAAWVRSASGSGMLVVGTMEIASWAMGDLGLAMVIEEGRRGMKATQSPTVHVRELLRTRSAVERFGLVFLGPVPTTETIKAGVEVHEPTGRVWPLVEVVDRSEEPRSKLIMTRTRSAISRAVDAGKPVFVLVPRRGYAPAFRCVRCKTLRRCQTCGAGPDKGDTCRRCGSTLTACVKCGAKRFEPLGAGVGRTVDELRRGIGDVVGPAGTDQPVVVGTERDLVGEREVGLAVAIDPDAIMLAPHYRAEEDALRLLARLAMLVRRGSGNRCLVQTALPQHDVITALTAGRPALFLDDVVERRAASGFPPSGQLIAIEIRGASDVSDEELRKAAGGDAVVFGPAPAGEGVRWLVQGHDLQPFRIRVRPLVQRWRDGGARVRVDVDPIDL